MPSPSASLLRPAVRMIGKRLAAANTPDKLRREFNYIAHTLLPCRGARTVHMQLGDIPTLQISTDNAASNRRAVLMLHGGGYVFGSPQGYAPMAGRYARASTATVFVPDYRLAPENPYPAALEDALNCYRDLLQRYPAENIALTGDSAGGGLSVAMLQAARAEDLPMPACLVLVSPWLDPSGSGESMRTNAPTEILILPETIARCARWYTGETDNKDKGICPLFASASGFPPTLIQVSGNEMLYSDSTRFASQAKEEDVDVSLQVQPDLWHVWQLMAPLLKEARISIDSLGRFIAQHATAD